MANNQRNGASAAAPAAKKKSRKLVVPPGGLQTARQTTRFCLDLAVAVINGDVTARRATAAARCVEAALDATEMIYNHSQAPDPGPANDVLLVPPEPVAPQA